MPICCENSTALKPPLDEVDDEDELEDDELDEELFDDEVLDDEELELVLDELVDELLPLQLETTPPSPHWSSHVFSPIQLWLFSQPQPLF